jgi:hypothetical protein
MFALRSGLQLWEIGCVAAFGTFTLHAGRNSVWLICLVAAPAACGLGERLFRGLVMTRRALLLCSAVPAAFLAAGFTQTLPKDGASERVREKAAALAAGRPILADGFDAERLALDGRRVWMANPLDAFSRRDQRLYLDWLDARPAGDLLLRTAGPVVLVSWGSPSHRRLARNPGFRSVTRDSEAVVYVRRTLLTDRRVPARVTPGAGS